MQLQAQLWSYASLDKHGAIAQHQHVHWQHSGIHMSISERNGN